MFHIFLIGRKHLKSSTLFKTSLVYSFKVRMFMAQLSVNVNKIATLRNARGQNQPNLIEAVKKLISFGVQSITVHPRPDGRHILYKDVRDIALLLQTFKQKELNVEGYPSPSFLKLMEEVLPSQCTLVPDPPKALTSNAGWEIQKNFAFLKKVLFFLKQKKIRTSLFVDPQALNTKELQSLSQLKLDRAELYTEAYAKAYSTNQKEEGTHIYTEVAKALVAKGIEVNAGHDLNLKNIKYLLKKVPQIKEVSIGHALICEALDLGLKTVTKKYLRICAHHQKSLCIYSTPLLSKDQKKGKLCEDIALAFFEKQGWCLRKRNQKIAGVEIDLILEKPNSWLLVEVKSDNTWRREQPMSQHQKKRLSKAFSAFCEGCSKPVQVLLAIVDKTKKVHTFDLEF